ncbi:protein containing Signal transduction response regulator, receiver region [Candidatus Magnetomorum sp. HK-1]|nr:protein containing Signal transduction response regulator, receiver region [Candidatus Magnetomorum sp. HK-1]
MTSSKTSPSDISVLIAEDNDVNSFLLKKIFEQQDCEANLFSDGLSAYEAFQKKFYALLILDIGLPGLDGLSLCRKIRELPGGNDCFILIYTGYSDTEKLSAAIEAGADDFLNKGTSPKMFRLRLEIAMRTVLGQMEKHQAAISIRESEQKARAIIDASPDIVVMVDKNGIILDANQMLTKIMNSRRSALMGKNIFSFYSESIAHSRKAYLDQAVSGLKTVQFEDNIEDIHFKHNIYPIIESDNTVEKIVIYSTDITREKQLSSQRKESEERYRHLFEYTSVPLWERDYSNIVDTLITIYNQSEDEDAFSNYFWSHKDIFWELISRTKTMNANQASVDVFGSKDAEQFIKKTSEIIFERSIPAMIMIFKTIAQKKRLVSGEIELQRFDHTNLDMLFQWVVMPGAETDYSRVLISMIDITALKNTEQYLRNERNFNTAILDNANTMIMVTDWYGKIVRFNRTCQQLTGYMEDEVLNKNYWETQFSDHSDFSTKKTFEFIRESGRLSSFESSWITKTDKTCLISWSITTMGEKDGHPLHIVFVGMDITEKRKAEKEAKHRQQQLMQADKMVALGTLVSGVAHEINNPTGIISLNGPMLKKGWASMFSVLDKHENISEKFEAQGVSLDKLKKRTPFLIEQIIESARRIKRIVSELKDYARQDLTDMNQRVDINDVIKTSVNLVINKIKKSTHNYSFQYFPKELMVKGNFQRLEQIFINVLINACEALSDTNQSISVNTFPDESLAWAIIQIKDQGIGISEQALQNLFDPFFTTKRDNGGTGLGMAVSHGIIEEHGGTIQYKSEPGEGTICQIKIPLD